MDGLHKLIEMLEKRFGKFWADFLLLIVVLGAAGWAINSFMTYLVLPAIKLSVAAYGYVSGAHITLPSNTNDIIWAFTEVFIYLNAVLSVVLFRRNKRVWTSADELFARYDALLNAFQEREAAHIKTIEELKEQNAVLTAANADD